MKLRRRYVLDGVAVVLVIAAFAADGEATRIVCAVLAATYLIDERLRAIQALLQKDDDIS